MPDPIREKLLKVPAEKLVDLLIELGRENEVSWSKVERLISGQSENVARFKRRLKAIKARNSFVPWKYSNEFADELTDLLSDLKDPLLPSEVGFELIGKFFKGDAAFFETCDDSSGHIGTVFHSDAFDLFKSYASKHPDRALVLNTVVELVEGNEYGARDVLVTEAHRYLSEPELRQLFQKFEEKDRADVDKFPRWEWKLASLAKQLKDGPLHEKIVRDRTKGEPNSKQFVEIAAVYFSAGDIEKSQAILDSTRADDPFAKHERDELQEKIYRVAGNHQKLYDLLYRNFSEYYSKRALEELVAEAGEDRRELLVAEAKAKISSDKHWSSGHSTFLAEIQDAELLEKYIVTHFHEIDGDHYSSLLPLVEVLEEEKRFLPASLLYRALTDSILARAKSKYYHHGVRYLKRLGIIQKEVSLWDGFGRHQEYLDRLRADHKRKSSFWQQYDKVGG